MKQLLTLVLLALLLASAPLSGQESFFLNPVGTIIIDPGHGGRDPGAVRRLEESGGTGEILEKDITLALALQTGELLEMLLPDIEVIYTREDDTYISLWKRTHIANTAPHRDGRSKLFISIHVNSVPEPGPSGFEIWRLDPGVEKDFFTTYVVEEGIISMTADLNRHLNAELDEASDLLAETLRSALRLTLEEQSRDRGVKSGRFYVLEHTVMPAVLAETGFLSNEQEAAALITPEYQERISSALAAGIISYIEQVAVRRFAK